MTDAEFTEAWRESVASALRMALAETGMSRLSLAAEAGIHDSTLGRYFKGQRDLPADVLFVIAPFLNTTPGDVMFMAQSVLEKRTSMTWDEHVLAAKRGRPDHA